MTAHSAFLRLLHLIVGHRWTCVASYAPWEPTPHRRGTFDCPFVYSCSCGKERVEHVKWD